MRARDETTYPLALPAGSMLDHYEIVETLGCGTFGVTYRGFSHKFKQPCVLKELLPSDYTTRSSTTQHVVPLSSSAANIFERCRKDFMREATVLHSVNHPSVVKILDFFSGNDTCYFVMPYANGRDLKHCLDEPNAAERFGEDDLMRFLHPILDGLEAVHATGFLHRDLKPENIIILETGQPLLIDFGAARQLIGSRSRPMSMILTRQYAPAEQYSSTQNQGPYTDIYALGAVLHRIIAGEPPVEATDRVQEQHEELPLAIRMAGRGYSSRLLEAVDWALQPLARTRPQNIKEWRTRLPAVPPPAPPQPLPTARRKTLEVPPEPARTQFPQPLPPQDLTPTWKPPTSLNTKTVPPPEPKPRRVPWKKVLAVSAALAALTTLLYQIVSSLAR